MHARCGPGNPQARGLRGLLLLVVLAVGLAICGNAQAASGTPCVIPSQELWALPETGGDPVKVSIEFFLIDLQDVSEVAGSYTVDFGLTLIWRDPRVVDIVGDGEGCIADLQDVWNPAFVFLNASESGTDHVGEVELHRNGEVVFSRRYTRTFNTKLDLKRFPFDKQELPITIVSALFSPDEVEFASNSELIDQWEGAQLSAWTLKAVTANMSMEPVVRTGVDYSATQFRILVERRSEFYLWRLVLPLFLVTLMAWAVFWLDPIQVAPQVTVATGSIFSLMSLLIGQTQMLPKLHYMTIADSLIVVSLLLVFSAFGETVMTGTLSLTGRLDRAKRIDRIGRRLYISVFAVEVAWVAVLYLR